MTLRWWGEALPPQPFARRYLILCPGASLLLIDGQNEQHKKPCGGLLAPDSQKALAHFDLTLPKEVLVDPQIFTVQTIDLCSRQVRYYQRYYLNMDRYAFDRWLLSLVPSQAEILPGRCTAVARREDSFSLTVRTDGKERHFTARRVVGADGASSLVRRTFYREPKTRYTAIQQWFPAGENRAPFYSCIFDPGHQRKLFLDHTERRHPDFWRLLFSTGQQGSL